MNRIFYLCLICVIAASVTATPCCTKKALFQESISQAETHRFTKVPCDSGVIAFEERLAGNDNFGEEQEYLRYTHSIVGAYPPLLPGTGIDRVSLKLFFRSHTHRLIEVTVDSVKVRHPYRRYFIVRPDCDEEVTLSDLPLRDGQLEVVIKSKEGRGEHNHHWYDCRRGEFVLRRSVLNVIYDYDLVLDADEEAGLLPREENLQSNYPNPFNASTIIEFNLKASSPVKIDVFNTLGQTVRTLVNEVKPAGAHQIEWNGKFNTGIDAPSGTYFYRITTDAFTETKKMSLLK